MPWPWEAPYPELPSGHPTKKGAADLLATLPDTGPAGVSGGELANRVSPRDTRDQLEQLAIQSTDGSPAAREWAARKARIAIRNWDAGVRAGSIHRTDRS